MMLPAGTIEDKGNRVQTKPPEKGGETVGREAVSRRVGGSRASDEGG